MPARRRLEACIPLLLAAVAFAVAFLQRPGWATSDTKINLHVSPERFLGDVASMWSSTGGLGQVTSGQYTGYLFPMGPFFALGDALGLSPWVTQRLWLGVVLALTAWGTVRLMDALRGRPRGVAHLVAGSIAVLDPYVVVYANRTTVTLLASMALPWLLLAVHRGLRAPTGWRWPAAIALLVAASGGGVNGAVTAWMLLGPAVLIAYECWTGDIGWRAVRGLLVRALPLILLLNLWWLVAAWVQAGYGIDFLAFTEQPGTVWGTTSAAESIRLMGFWLSYVGISFSGPPIAYFDDSHTMLFAPAVVWATFLLPAAALGGYVWTRRWRYGPFFLLLALVGVLGMMAGFPDGTGLRHGLIFTYNHLEPVRFLRASYKVAPLLAVALACLGGAAVGEAWRRLGAAGRPALRPVLGVATAAVLALAAWPLVTGVAQDAQVSWKRIPGAWTGAASGLGRDLPANARAVVLPGSQFAFYRWGGTVDPILPALTSRPVAERGAVPYADPHATELLTAIDDLVHQRRLVPGQLPGLLDLIGAGAVVVGTDSDRRRSDAPDPWQAAATLAGQGLTAPARRYGPSRRVTAPAGDLGPAAVVPQVRRYDRPAGHGLVRVAPAAAPVVVDGSATALAGLAAFGALPRERVLLAADRLAPAAIAPTLTAGSELVVADGNRRQAYAAARIEQSRGPTLPADRTVSEDGVVLDVARQGSPAQTVQVLGGIAGVDAPASPAVPQFPEHRPFAALDGDPATAWLADRTLTPDRHALTVTFLAPRDVPYVDVLPYDDAGGTVRSVVVAGRTHPVHRGWNRLRVGARDVRSLTVAIGAVGPPAPGHTQSAGGLRELRIPGVRATETLRLPVRTTDAVAGRLAPSVALSYLFSRTTGDDPFTPAAPGATWSAATVEGRGDAERGLRRVFSVPAARAFGASAWVTVAAGVSDGELDRLAGLRGGRGAARSSGRFLGRPGLRASSAFDGDPATAWIGPIPAAGTPWLSWRAATPMTVRTLRLDPARAAVRRPSRVRLSWPGGRTGPLAVRADGTVPLGRTVRATSMRLDVLATAPPPGAGPATRARRAVGIAAVRGIAGAPVLRSPRTGRLALACGVAAVAVDGRTVPLRVTGTRAAFDAGTPLRATSCAAPLRLAAGTHRLTTPAGPFAVYLLRLRSPSNAAGVAAAAVAPRRGGGAVLDPGTAGRGAREGTRVAVRGPSWLILGEGYSRGWHAWCQGRDLGEPTLVDGYANGWRVGAGCRDAHFAFAPNATARVAFWISGVSALLALLVLAGAWWRARRRGDAGAADTAPDLPAGGPIARLGWGRAAAAGLVGAVVFGFVFGILAGLLAGAGLALALRLAVRPGPLAVAAGVLLAVAAPLLTLVAGDDGGTGGNHFGYATGRMAAHWVTVAAIGLLMVALARGLAAARSSRPKP